MKKLPGGEKSFDMLSHFDTGHKFDRWTNRQCNIVTISDKNFQRFAPLLYSLCKLGLQLQ